MADDKTLINIKKIHWIKQYKECMYVCTKPNGCTIFSAHEVCKKKNIENYLKLHIFEENRLPC